tara:strand:- start:7514 stop:7726 length:213 start_codon:yes stop_codon:yes gene_type:complete
MDSMRDRVKQLNGVSSQEEDERLKILNELIDAKKTISKLERQVKRLNRKLDRDDQIIEKILHKKRPKKDK